MCAAGSCRARFAHAYLHWLEHVRDAKPTALQDHRYLLVEPDTPYRRRNDRSAGKQRSGRTRKGSRWLNSALKDAAMAAIRTRNTYLRALYERHRSRIGHGKAIGAVKHSMLVAVWHILTNGELYNDLGPDYYRRRDPARTTKRLVAQLERLGHTVTLQEAAA